VLAGWVLTNPVGASPDELNHVLRAQAVGRGDLSGRPNPELAAVDTDAEAPKACCGFDNPVRGRWVQRGARLVEVPSALDFGTCLDLPPGFVAACVDDRAVERGPSEVLTTMGTLEPGPYVLPGLATRLADDPVAAVRWARAANAVTSLVLLALATFVLWSPGGALAWLGLLAAVSPMVLFIGASPAPSAVEVSGGICFVAALLRLARAPEQPAGPAVWGVLAIGGAALAASRSLGPVWVVLDVVAVAAVAGPGRLWRTVRRGRGWAVGGLAVVVVAAAGTAVWELTHQPGIPFDVGFFFNQLGPSTSDLARVHRELVGVFGSIDVPLPAAARTIWTVLVGALLLAALAVGRGRERIVLAAVVVAGVVITLVVSSALLRQNGFQVQGRHVLAFVVLVPLLAGEVVLANRARMSWLRPGPVLAVVAAVAVAIHVVGVSISLRHYAGTPDHVPSVLPGPWWAWVVTAIAVGAVTIAVSVRHPAPR